MNDLSRIKDWMLNGVKITSSKRDSFSKFSELFPFSGIFYEMCSDVFCWNVFWNVWWNVFMAKKKEKLGEGGLTFDVLGSDRPLHVTLLHSQNILTHPSQMKYITGKQNICEGRGRALKALAVKANKKGPLWILLN